MVKDKSDVHEEAGGSFLIIEVYDGEHLTPGSENSKLCRLEGNVLREDGPPFTLREQLEQLLEIGGKYYGVPNSAEGCFTAFVTQGHTAKVAMRIVVITRPDALSARLFISEGEERALEVASVFPEDDVFEMLRKALRAQKG